MVWKCLEFEKSLCILAIYFPNFITACRVYKLKLVENTTDRESLITSLLCIILVGADFGDIAFVFERVEFG